jgi:hypothetical protein
MPLPHHQSGYNKNREEDKPNCRRIIGNLVERTVDVADYRDSEDDMDPTKIVLCVALLIIQFLLLRV